MSKVVVVSDSHRFTNFIEKLPRLYPDARLFLHAGDSELTTYDLFPFQTVKGNCDYQIDNKYYKTTVDGVGILMLHGDHTYLSEDLLVGMAHNHNVQIIIHGHTHIPYYKQVGDVHILCPGSLAYPRVSRATYAIVTINSINDIKVEIKNYE